MQQQPRCHKKNTPSPKANPEERSTAKPPLFVMKQNEYGKLSVYASVFIPKHTLLLTELPVLRGHEIETVTLRMEAGTYQCQADDDAFMQYDRIDESTRGML